MGRPWTRNPTALRDWLFSVSLANFCFWKTWAAVLQTGRNITPVAYLTAVALVLAGAVAIRLGIALVRRNGKSLLRFAAACFFGAMLLLPTHAAANIYFNVPGYKRPLMYAIGAAIAAAVALSSRMRRLLYGAMLLLSPYVLVTFGQALVRASSYDASRWKPAAIPEGQARPHRAVWIMFDEWDYGLSFETVKPKLPQVDRLRAESFSAVVLSAKRSTPEAIPALLSGRKGTTLTELRTGPTVFSLAHAQGLRVGVIGWFLPYCELFSSRVTACWSPDLDARRNSMGSSISQIAVNQTRELFEFQTRSPFGQSLGTLKHSWDYGVVRDFGLRAATAPALDLVFIHVPIPHLPAFYDQRTGRFDLGEKPVLAMFRKNHDRYLDALVLMDRMLGEVRAGIEAAGLSDRTHLIVTSDHSYRERRAVDGVPNDPRVPLFVKVAGASGAVSYPRPFSNTLIADLVLALLDGRMRSPQDVSDWLNAHGS
jgi:hypothetical protein